MDWANVNLEIITVEECMEMYNQRGIVVILNDGKLVGLGSMKKDELLTKAAGMGLEVSDDDKVETLKEKIIAELSK